MSNSSPTDSTHSAHQDVPSPCVNVCEMDENRQYCKGCCRTIEEIRNWRASSFENKSRLLKVLHRRRKMIIKERPCHHTARSS